MLPGAAGLCFRGALGLQTLQIETLRESGPAVIEQLRRITFDYREALFIALLLLRVYFLGCTSDSANRNG